MVPESFCPPAKLLNEPPFLSPLDFREIVAWHPQDRRWL